MWKQFCSAYLGLTPKDRRRLLGFSSLFSVVVNHLWDIGIAHAQSLDVFSRGYLACSEAAAAAFFTGVATAITTVFVVMRLGLVTLVGVSGFTAIRDIQQGSPWPSAVQLPFIVILVISVVGLLEQLIMTC